MIMPMSLTACSDPERFIHPNKSHKPNHYSNTQQQIPIWLDHYKPHMLWTILPKENLR